MLTVYRIDFRADTKSYPVWTPIRYVTLHFRDRRSAAQRGAASLRYKNRAEITILICEQNP